MSALARTLLPILVCSASLAGGAEPAAKSNAHPAVQSLFEKHCLNCHDDTSAAGKLSLESLATAPMTDRRWTSVYDKLRSGEMPPKNKPRPGAEELKQATDALRLDLHKSSLAQQQAEGRVVLRRLNATEYETTLRDLLGKQVSVKDLLPPDTTAAGFDNISEVLDVSSVHLLRYQDAAEQALKTVVPRRPPAKIKSHLTGREVVSKQKNAVLGGHLRLDGDTLYIHAIPYAHISLGTATVPQAGRYLVRASLFAMGTEGKPMPVRMSWGKPWGRSTESVLAVRDIPANKAAVIEQEVELGNGDLVDFLGWSLPSERKFSDESKRRNAKANDPIDGPALVVEWVEVEGPLDAFPPAGYRNIFGDVPLKADARNTSLTISPTDPRADAERLMRSFLTLAFRRPVSRELLDYHVKIVHRALDEKQSFEAAMLIGCKAALCSPHFLLLAEPVGARKDQPAALDDFAIAARLSYFLWSTLPDHDLIDLATRGELHKPAALHAQVERLLKDPRSARFTENFAGQWLDLRKINETVPSPQTYGEFDDFLFWSMPNETKRFFEEVLRHDRSLTDFAHSDWTYLNERLAKHYGIPDVFGGELRLVKLPPDCHRGGVITQASIMKVTADGAKTSPILRGKWVLEKILGQPPAPPPPNVSAIEPDIRGAATIREQLDKHRTIESCAACHRHIDPPGFALESFDAIGGWRDFYRSTIPKKDALVPLANYPERKVYRGRDVEHDGVTTAGKAFRDIDEYKQILLADKDQLARNLAEKLLVYATGADIQFADREVIEDLVTKSRTKNYGFRSLIHDVVQSRVFLNK